MEGTTSFKCHLPATCRSSLLLFPSSPQLCWALFSLLCIGSNADAIQTQMGPACPFTRPQPLHRIFRLILLVRDSLRTSIDWLVKLRGTCDKR